jgi:hypothetical protein
VARANVAWRGVDLCMPADDLEKVDGENYRRVPRYIADDAPFWTTSATGGHQPWAVYGVLVR